MMPESWIAIGLFILLVFWALFRMIANLRMKAHLAEAEHERFRMALRRNINELIVDAIINNDGYEMDPMMQTAIEESIKAYRAHG